jgi:hypothetical protein
VRVQNVSRDGARLESRRQDHAHTPSRAYILDVLHQVLVLLDVRAHANQRSLQPLEHSMLGPCWVKAAETVFPAEHVDRRPIETSFHQGFNGRVSVLRLGDRPDDTIGGVRDEAAIC